MAERRWQIRRSLWGYRPSTVRRLLADLQAECAERERRLTDRLLELEVQGGAAAVAAPPAGPETAWDVPVLPWSLFGCAPTEVAAAVRTLQAEWSRRLQALADAIRRREAEPTPVPVLQIAAALAVAEPALHHPAAALADHLPERPVPDRAVPRRLTAAGGETAVRLRPRPWRPGAVEDAEDAPRIEPKSRVSAVGRLQTARPDPPPQPPAATEAAPPLPPAATADPRDLPGPDPQVTVGVRQRIELLFQRFLAGKLVGADLVTPHGELLAVRGTAVSHELVKRAEAAGVLPSLIAHMTLPGMDGE